MKRLTKALLKKWNDMTEDNLHYEVRLEIAKWAEDLTSEDGYVDGKYISYVKIFEELLYAIENTCTIMGSTQCFITHCMLNDIRRVYGEDVYKKINACL